MSKPSWLINPVTSRFPIAALFLFSLSATAISATKKTNKHRSKQELVTSQSQDSFNSQLSDRWIKKYYDGKTDDLLTAGLTLAELQQRQPLIDGDFNDPDFVRKATYLNNITSLLDTTDSGGYGRLYGPNFKQAIAGHEFLTYSVDKKGQIDAVISIQIPDNFNLDKPCIVVAASSGSRGVYGAVGTSGSWALENQCAVAYTDKGTGTGFYFPDNQGGYNIQGVYTEIELSAQNSGKNEIKTENQQTKLLTFNVLDLDNASTSKEAENKQSNQIHRVLTKHAYSEKNIEQFWGHFVIQAAEAGIAALDKHYEEKTLNPENTLIIAASISNGGGASLRAGELDSSELIDAIVVAEPNINLPPSDKQNLSIIVAGEQQPTHSVNSLDYMLAINLFSPCALLDASTNSKPFALGLFAKKAHFTQWCHSLKEDKYILGKETAELAAAARNKLKSLGVNAIESQLAPLSEIIKLWPALAVTYTNQFGKYSTSDTVCDVIFSATDGKGNPTSISKKSRQMLSSISSGIPPTGEIKLSTISNQSTYQVAKCFYELGQTKRIKNGIAKTFSNLELGDKPTIIIHGSEDHLIAPNHTSRAYFARTLEKNPASNIRYFEINHAQHFDAFSALPQFSSQYVPLHYYFEASLDLMLAHLRSSKILPPSQVIKPKQRKSKDGIIEPLSMSHLPNIKQDPKNIITYKDGVLTIP